MYRLLIKLDLLKDNAYRLYTVTNDKGEIVPYGADDLKLAQNEAMKLLANWGYNELKIINDGPYYINIEDGEEPKEPEILHNITIVCDKNNKTNCSIIPNLISDIKLNASVTSQVVFDDNIPKFHFRINGEDTINGLPEWIKIEILNKQEIKLYFNGITEDYIIEIVED